MPTKVMNGTDIYHKRSFDGDKKMIDFECPFTGEKLLLVPQTQPDIAVIHVSRADINGNAQLYGISSTIELIARAAKRVIVTAEEIVDEEVIRKDPSKTIIPGFLVDVVVHAPYGAHPAGMYRYYDYDIKHIDEYVNASRTKESMASYFNEYIYGTKNELDYLKKIGIERLLELRADPYFGYSLKNRGEI